MSGPKSWSGLPDARIIKRFYGWTLESFTEPNKALGFVLADGNVCNPITLYGEGRFGTVKGITRYDIWKYLDNNCSRLEEIKKKHTRKRPESGDNNQGKNQCI